MIREIVKEKTSADHLLYVSLKYTKTCDVILNLLARWKVLIDVSFDALLQELMKKKKITEIPKNPKQKMDLIKKYYRKEEFNNIFPLYLFFRRIPTLDKKREGEFRKNVNLKVIDGNKVSEINMDKLAEYSVLVDDFVMGVKRVLLE